MWGAVLRLHADPAAATAVSDRVWQVVAGIATELRIDPATSRLLRQARGACAGLNLRRLHQMLPELNSDTGGRWLGLEGVPGGASSYAVVQVAKPRLSSGLGAAAVTLGLAPWRESDAGTIWRVDADASVGTDPVEAGPLMALVEGVAAGLARGAGAEPGRALLPVLTAEFPRALAVVERYATLPRLGVRRGEMVELDATMCAAPGLPAWKSRPELARYLRNLGELLTARVSVHDRQGRKLAALSLDSQTMCVGVEAALSPAGEVVPRTAQGALVPEAAVSLTRTTRLDATAGVVGSFRFAGISAQLDGWKAPLAFGVSATQAYARGAITSEPGLSIQGDGAFSSWLVQLMESAFDLNEHASAMFRTIADGPGGAGSTFALTHQDRRVRLTVAATLVDNGLVRLAASVVAGRLFPSDQAFAEAYAVLAELLKAVGEDYQTARRGPLAVGR